MTSLYVISDIHGRFNEMKNVLSYILDELKENKAKLVFLGDYIGYGPDSLKTVEAIMKMNRLSSVIVLRGNWEDMVVQVFRDSDPKKRSEAAKTLRRRGAGDFLDAISQNNRYDIVDFFESLPLYHQDGVFFFAHSGLNFDLFDEAEDVEEFISLQTKEDLLYNFSYYEQIDLYDTTGFPYYLVSGHVPIQTIREEENLTLPILGPFQYKNCINVDFGASKKDGKVGLVRLFPSISTILVPVISK